MDQPHSDEDGYDCDRQGRDQFQRQRRQECGPEGTHGLVPIVPRDVFQRLSLRARTAKPNQDREALRQFEHVAGKPGQRCLRVADLVLCVASDQHHEQWNQRHC